MFELLCCPERCRFPLFDGRPSRLSPLVLSLETTTPIELCRLEVRLIVDGEKKLLRWVLPVRCPRRLELPVEDRRTVLSEEREDGLVIPVDLVTEVELPCEVLRDPERLPKPFDQLIAELPTRPLRLPAVVDREVVRCPVFCRTGVVTADRLPVERCVMPERELVMVDLCPRFTDGDLVLLFGVPNDVPVEVALLRTGVVAFAPADEPDRVATDRPRGVDPVEAGAVVFPVDLLTPLERPLVGRVVLFEPLDLPTDRREVAGFPALERLVDLLALEGVRLEVDFTLLVPVRFTCRPDRLLLGLSPANAIATGPIRNTNSRTKQFRKHLRPRIMAHLSTVRSEASEFSSAPLIFPQC